MIPVLTRCHFELARLQVRLSSAARLAPSTCPANDNESHAVTCGDRSCCASLKRPLKPHYCNSALSDSEPVIVNRQRQQQQLPDCDSVIRKPLTNSLSCSDLNRLTAAMLPSHTH